MSKIHFYKMHGAGNDFILFDNSSKIFAGNESGIFRKICLPHTGIGADGVILLEKSENTDFKMKYFNSDGLPGEMCGNGGRCAVYLANSLGLAPKVCSFEIGGMLYNGEVSKNKMVSLQMHPPQILLSTANAISLLAGNFRGAMWMMVGVPHFVVESDKPLDELDVHYWGRYYRYHKRFHPNGANVNFVFASGQNQLKARVYERGVERETLACGTGAIACAVYANQRYNWQSPIEIHFPGGALTVEFEPGYQRLFLNGPVEWVFEGDLAIANFK